MVSGQRAYGVKSRFCALSLLAAIEQPGEEEEQGEHKGELGVGAGPQVQPEDSVDEPGSAADEPDPGGAAAGAAVFRGRIGH